MEFKLTSRADLRRPQFWWRHAFLLLWFATVIFLSKQISDLAIYIFLLAPVFGFFIGRLIPDTPADFQGMLLLGSLACSMITPGIYATLRYKAVGYTLFTRVVDLSELCIVIPIAMAIGFFATRYVARFFRSSSF